MRFYGISPMKADGCILTLLNQTLNFFNRELIKEVAFNLFQLCNCDCWFKQAILIKLLITNYTYMANCDHTDNLSISRVSFLLNLALACQF